MIGQTISHYKITEKLGGGGMGVVYKARDLKLDRFVALKFLPQEHSTEEEHNQRFIHEAKAASALDHPNVCTIYEIGESEDGQTFIAMAFYPGETLKKKIQRRPLPLAEALAMTLQAGRGLAKAHEQRIVHRDIKPANLMVTTDGVVKIVDFGLARLGDATQLTQTGSTMGTPAYMSPEQALGEKVDHRSDIWSLGVVLYEMVTGQLPFKGEVQAAIAYSIVNEEPEPVTALRSGVPIELDRMIDKALAKDMADRYQHVDDMLVDLQVFAQSGSLPAESPDGHPSSASRSLAGRVSRPQIAIPVMLALIALVATLVWLRSRNTRIDWAKEQALPEIARLIDRQQFFPAFRLLQQAEPYLPADADVSTLREESSREISVQSTPPEVEVFIQDYADVDGEWYSLGQTPLQSVTVPWGFVRWRCAKDGYEEVVVARRPRPEMTFTLSEIATLPPGKLHVPAGNIGGWITGINPLERFTTDDFLIDKYEVKNRGYKTFIDNGGYRDKQYWKQTFVEDGREINWKDAIARFVDRTGRPGPSTWELGDYPDGQDDYPVSGVSWYEAAAYAEFKGDALPTVYHWISSAGTWGASSILPLSNFGNAGTSQVGEHRGIGVAGAYDMAGNVREWCWNEFRGQRYILGGAWSDPTYMFTFANVKSPFDRSSTNGFRYVRYLSEGKSNKAFGPVELLIRDYTKEKPVSEEIFQVYRDQFSYDSVELDPQIESTDDSADDWTEQKVSFKAAYGDERVIAYLFLPKTARPPYQTVIMFPGSGAIRARSLQPGLLDYARSVAKGGRALAWPIYKGTYERNEDLASTWPNETRQYVDYATKWVQDLRRTIDYLETRDEIDSRRLAYLGISWGARMGAIIPAVEERLKVSILWSGGLAAGRSRPEVDQINFVSRVKIPVLMLNGRYDAIEPLETAQLPMLQLLGTPEGQKRHVVYDSGHGLPRNESIKEILNWLDEHLGPIE